MSRESRDRWGVPSRVEKKIIILFLRVGGMTWDDFLAARIADLVKAGGWDGVFYDNLNDLAFSPLVDVNNDNHPDGGIVDGVNVWREGERHLLARTRQLLPGGLRVTRSGPFGSW